MEEIDHDFAEQIAIGLFRVFQGLDICKGTGRTRLLTLGQDAPEQVRLATPDLTQNQPGTVQCWTPGLLLDQLPETTKRVFVNGGHIGIGRFPGVAHTGGNKRIVPPEEVKSGIVHHRCPRQLRAIYNVPSASVKEWRSSSSVITEGSPPCNSTV